MRRARFWASALLLCWPLSVASAQDSEPELDLNKIRDEILSISRRDPHCLTDGSGLPKRVIITDSAGMYEKPNPPEGTKPLDTLSPLQRMYVYVKDDGSGFFRLGYDAFGEKPAGWVSKSYILEWDHDEMLFLNRESVSDREVNKIYVWKSLDDATTDDPSKPAKWAAQEDVGVTNMDKIFFPVLKKDPSGRYYEIGFLQGGDGMPKDSAGRELSREQVKQIASNLANLNVILVIDATGSMEPYIEEVKRRASEIIDSFNGSKLGLKVSFMLVAYRDRGDDFDTKVFVPPTGDVAQVKRQLADLTADGGGDKPEMVVEAIRLAIKESGAGSAESRGSLTRMFLIGDAPPHQSDPETLSSLADSVQSKWTQIFALKCGDDPETEKTFRIIAENAGGKLKSISEAAGLTTTIMAELAARASGTPVEKAIVEKSIEAIGKPAGADPVKDLGLNGEQIRIMRKFLVERGADISAGGSGLRTGWVRVLPGTGARLKVHVLKPRWRLALELSKQLGLSSDLLLGKKLDETIPALAGEFIRNLGGESASAGLKGGDVKERGASLPEASDAVRKGTTSIDPDKRKNTQKIRDLVRFLRSKDVGSDDGYVWVPVGLVP